MTRIMLDVEFVIEECCYEGCGVTWAVPSGFHKKRLYDHASFYCPNGHSQHYAQRSKEEKLSHELKCCRAGRDEWRRKARTLERSRRSLKGHVTRLKKAMRGDALGGEQVAKEQP